MSLVPKNLPPFPPIPDLSPEVQMYFRDVAIYLETNLKQHNPNLTAGSDPGHTHTFGLPATLHADVHELGGTDPISHDDLTDFVAGEHYNHTGISIIAGTNLNGGGAITATRTLNLDASPSVTSLIAGTLTVAAGSIIDSGGTIDIGAFGAGNNVDVNILFGDTTLSDLYAGTLRLLDSVGETNYLQFLSAGTELTADRAFSIDVGNAARTITLSGNPTLDNWFDQSVKTTATPTFPQVNFDGVDVAYIDVDGNDLEVLNNVTGGNLILGTVSGYVSVSEDLVVNGTVGIGTTNPTFGKLEVYGNGADTTLAIHEDAGTHKAQLHLRSGGGDVKLYSFGSHFYIDAESVAQAFTILTDGKVGIGTNAPDSIFHIKANFPGWVGNNYAGQLIIQDPDNSVFGNAVITGYESDDAGNPDQQLWYLGSSSINDSNIIFLNRRNSKLQLGTNGVSRLTILGNGNVGIGTATPTAALQMGDDKLIAVDTNAGITASITQTQGDGALTAQANEISTVANKDDNVTLPTAVTGIEIEIINNGANTLWIFPASGDNLGLGVNTAEELQANERVKFVAYDTTNWAKESTTEIIHAEIHDEDNTDAFVINDAGADFHSYHTNGLAAGDLADWTFDAGGAGTSFPIASIADGVDSGVDIEVTTTGNHLLAVGDIISQTNLADAAYVGIFEVKAIISATQYEVAAVYTADGTGTMDQAATLEADAVAAGVYSFAYCISATPVGNNETFDFQLYKEATAITGSKIRRKFGAGGDFGSMSGCGVISVGSGEKISFALSNEDTAANLTIRNLTIVLIRL